MPAASAPAPRIRQSARLLSGEFIDAQSTEADDGHGRGGSRIPHGAEQHDECEGNRDRTFNFAVHFYILFAEYK